MRWLLALLLMANPVMAAKWSCRSGLTPDHTAYGQSHLVFNLEISDVNFGNSLLARFGNFFFASLDSSAYERLNPSWGWRGKWTPVEDQIAMIGAASVRNSPVNRLFSFPSGEVRAFSTVFEDDVLILNMVSTQQLILIRCLPEPT